VESPYPRQAGIHDKLLGDCRGVGVEIPGVFQQGDAHFAEERIDDHVQFPEHRSLLALAEYLVDDQRNKQDLDEQKPNVAHQIDEDMVGIPEGDVVQAVDNRREQQQDDRPMRSAR
jgi:hypothetical protein